MRVSLRPPLEGEAAQRFVNFARQIRHRQKQGNFGDLKHLLDQELAWSKSASGAGTYSQKFQAICLVLCDLARLNWEIRDHGFGIELQSPPVPHARGLNQREIQEFKLAVRRELEPLRDAQLQDKNVRAFIARMEAGSPAKGRSSILDLVADGREVFARLNEGITDRVRRPAILETAVRPYLQLVEEDRVDEFTKIALGDVWRYFRYTWSIPATSIPGRQVLYLVRDAAHPRHAVMGIAGLNNCAMQVKDRDDYIGWSLAGFRRRIESFQISSDSTKLVAQEHEYLLRELDRAIAAIDATGLLTSRELKSPNRNIVARLRRQSEVFATERGELLANLLDNEQADTLGEMEGGPGPLDDERESPDVSDRLQNKSEAKHRLMAKKRALELARLLQAKITLEENRADLLDPSHAVSSTLREEIASAISIAFGAIKNFRVGSSLLELTTCGAIPPYNTILGGKLVALLMLSPEVAADYRRRYGSEPSIIASEIANKPVVRDATLAYVGTTGLYALGSSQYNRLSLPAGIISDDQHAIRYHEIGETSGYGTVQFSPATTKAIEELLTSEQGYRHVNSVFGEGPSPKLRKISAGLRMIGFDPELVLRHNQTRVIYGAPLFSGATDFLCNRQRDAPTYSRDPEQFRGATERIASYWRSRWLASRLDSAQAVAMLRQSKPRKLSDAVPVADTNPTAAEAQKREPKKARGGRVGNKVDTADVAFWRKLAWAGPNATADELTSEELERLHVELPIEAFIVEQVRKGRSIVLTGNAGDGKTHLFRRLEPALRESRAVIELDATARMRRGDPKAILEAWRKAVTAGRPYCLAANEFPLFMLRQRGKGKLDVIDEVDAQCRRRLEYELPTKAPRRRQTVVVIDLSLRNPLGRPLASSLIAKLISDDALRKYAKSGDDLVFARNFAQLSDPFVQSRILDAFSRLVVRGHRCTLREIWVLLARLLFGASKRRTNDDQSPAAWLSERLFHPDARFPLSQWLSQIADPKNVSNPAWDSKIEDSEFVNDKGWHYDVRSITASPDLNAERFYALKRAFYLFHNKGDEAFRLDPPWGSEFAGMLAQAERADTLALRRIVEAINSCYCPLPFNGNGEALMLWIGHRFHEQPTKSYVASQRVSASELTLSLPHLPKLVEGALEYPPDHLRLSCSTKHGTASLIIDYGLYEALEMLRQSIPRQMIPDKYVSRIDRFMDQLQRLQVPEQREFICFNAETRTAALIQLNGQATAYTEVKKIGR